MADWHVGQMVVCIKKFKPKGRRPLGERKPVLKHIYTIIDIFIHNGEIAFRFEEIVNAPHKYSDFFGECAFHVKNFRPVKKTSIACFEAILKSVPSLVNTH